MVSKNGGGVKGAKGRYGIKGVKVKVLGRSQGTQETKKKQKVCVGGGRRVGRVG